MVLRSYKSVKIDEICPLAIPNQISLIFFLLNINAYTKFGKIPWHLLKLSSRNENMGMSRADNSIKIWWNLPISNPKPDLHNINAHTKFGENLLMFTQVIIQERNTDWRMDRHTDVQCEIIIPRHYPVVGYKKSISNAYYIPPPLPRRAMTSKENWLKTTYCSQWMMLICKIYSSPKSHNENQLWSNSHIREMDQCSREITLTWKYLPSFLQGLLFKGRIYSLWEPPFSKDLKYQENNLLSTKVVCKIVQEYLLILYASLSANG